MRYQPFDHTVVEGLGDSSELTQLCALAKSLDMIVIADLVFNHMAIPIGATRQDWLTAAAKDKKAATDDLYAKLAQFPGLTREDFAPWQDMQGRDWDSEKRYEAWGNGEWPELLPTPNVISRHKQHLQQLYDCGVRGFRFDAVKHMRVAHLEHYATTIQNFAEPCWIYGEVFSDRPAMHAEYRSLFPTTDFVFIRKLLDSWVSDAPITINPEEYFLDDESVRFAHNHDLALNPKELVAGLLFSSPEATQLATCLTILSAGGTALVFAPDETPLIRGCVWFRRETGGLEGQIVVSPLAPNVWQVTGSPCRSPTHPALPRKTASRPQCKLVLSCAPDANGIGLEWI
jgi:alpha-amylase